MPLMDDGKYFNIATSLTLPDGAEIAVREWRRRASTDIEEMTSVRKQLESERDMDGARFLSGYVKSLNKQVRAATIVLDNLFGRGSSYVPPSAWPKELAQEFDSILWAAESAT